MPEQERVVQCTLCRRDMCQVRTLTIRGDAPHWPMPVNAIIRRDDGQTQMGRPPFICVFCVTNKIQGTDGAESGSL